MSAKQMKRLRDLRQAEASATAGEAKEDERDDEEEEEDEEKEKEVEDDEEEPTSGTRARNFAALMSDSDSGGSEPVVTEEDPLQPSAVESTASKQREQTSGPSGTSRSARRRRKGGHPTSQSPATGATDKADDDVFGTCGGEAAASEGAQDCEDAPGADVEQSTNVAVLSMHRAAFSAENERRRRGLGPGIGAGIDRGATSGNNRNRRTMVQLRGGTEGRTVHHRRLFLTKPTADEPWNRPDDGVTMVAHSDRDGAGYFDLEETPASRRSLQQLLGVLRSQDPQLLQDFLQHNPFCVDGLLALAEYLCSQHSYEQAFQLVRRAVYAIECNFHPNFSPFQPTAVGAAALRPRVRLCLSSDESWVGWSWIRALWLYMHCFSFQGMHRTALEVCKLLLAATLPRDPAHALLCVDKFMLRAKQYEALLAFSQSLISQCCIEGPRAEGRGIPLDLCLPSFAYSCALAGFLHEGAKLDVAALNDVSISDIVPDGAGTESGSTSCARLLRALLIFPLALRPLLEEVDAKLYAPAPPGFTSQDTWADLLAKPPFSDAGDFRHTTHAAVHGRLSATYAKQCGALWKADSTVKWLHTAAARLTRMHDSSVFAREISAARASWTSTELCLDAALAEDYADVLPEVPRDGEAPGMPHMPAVLERAAQTRLRPPALQGAEGLGDIGQDGPAFLQPRAVISLYSPPLLIFFQSLLPWAELDRSGVKAEPLRWMDLVWGSLHAAQGVGLFTFGAACDLSRLGAALVQRLRAKYASR